MRGQFWTLRATIKQAIYLQPVSLSNKPHYNIVEANITPVRAVKGNFQKNDSTKLRFSTR